MFSATTKTRYKTVLIVLAGALALAILYGLWLANHRSVEGINPAFIGNDGGLNSQAHALIEKASQAEDSTEMTQLLQDNPGLINFLSHGIQSQSIEKDWSNDESIELATNARLLNNIVSSAHSGKTLDSLERAVDKETFFTLSNYLQALVNSRKRAGQGAIANLDNVDTQMAVFEAYRLNQSLQAHREWHKELAELASWYQAEIQTQSRTQQFPQHLLHYAWQVAELEREISQEDRVAPESLELRTSADLLRLLNHSEPAVIKNSARLLALFTPDNAVTPLRYQLLKATENDLRFLLLDAIKSYAQERDQFETQLNKMLRMTKDTAFQKKIVETIDHLNGRSGSQRLSS